MNVGWIFRKLVRLAAVAVAVLPSTVQAFIPHVSDHIGSIRALVDAKTGATVAEYEYDPYGVMLEEAGGKAHVCPFRFSSKYYDPETQLLYFGYRYYNPVSTKWFTVDPLQERGGLNFTAYCGGDPVNQVDPLGLYWQRNANGKWEWVSGSSCILEDMVSPGIDTIAQIGQAVPDIWSGVWEVLQNTRIPESPGNDFFSAAWNGVAGAGNAILEPLTKVVEPRPQDYDDGLLMVNEALWGSGNGSFDRLKLGGLGALVMVGSAMDVVDFVPDPGDALQKSARDAGLGMMRRSSKNADMPVKSMAKMRTANEPKLLTAGGGIPNAGGIIHSFIQETDQIYFRVSSGNSTVGSFLTAVPPRSGAWAQEALSLPPWNNAEFIQEVMVPAGTRLQRSRALPVPLWQRFRGGGEQFELLDIIPTENFGPRRPLP